VSAKIHRILCVSCRKNLFSYRGDFTGFIRSRDFYPFPGVDPPGPGKPLLCTFCHQPFYMVNARTGGPIVMTDSGWKPREPEGHRDLDLLRADNARGVAMTLKPELPPDLEKGGDSDWIDPLASMRDRKEKKRGKAERKD
jgi:hypothetical protein